MILFFIVLKETVLLSFTDNATRQLRGTVRDIFDGAKKKFKRCSCKRSGEKSPIMLKPDGKGPLFANKEAVDMFVRSFMECVSSFKYPH